MTKEEKERWYNGNEENDFNMLSSITSGILFSNIEKGEKFGCDAYASGHNRTFNIEIKNRNINHNQYSTILIESDKYGKAWNDYIYDGREQLYINFFKDDYMLIWNLSKKLKHKPQYSPWRLKSENYGQVCEGRFGLYVEDAAIYKITKNGIILENARQ